jgi:uroporphyrinogen III methyltransferase/synthase
VAEHFAEEFLQRISRSDHVLVGQSSEGRNVFSQKLQGQGISVDTMTTYTTRSCLPTPAEVERVVVLQKGEGEAYILFMSPSAVHATVTALGAQVEALKGYRIVSVGPITTRAVRSYGLGVAAEAVEHSEGGIVRALQELSGR